MITSQSSRSQSDPFSFITRSSGTLGFDFGAKAYRFGIGMDEAEAKMLLTQVKEISPKLVAGR